MTGIVWDDNVASTSTVAAFVLMTIRLLIVFFSQTMTFTHHASTPTTVRFFLAVALAACVALPARASTQDKKNQDDKNGNNDKQSQGGGSRPPSAFETGILPICYGRVHGEPRLVRPWNVANRSTPTCQPPEPWDAVGVPAGGWAAAQCTTGGSFDCPARQVTH